MGRLTKMTWPTTSVLALLEDAEHSDKEIFDVVHLELNTGRDFVIAVVAGDKAERAAQALEQLKAESK